MSLRVSTSLFSLALGLSSVGPAAAGPIYENQSGGTFTFYGQFNPAFTSFDDGVTTSDEFGDNGSSNSRVGILITQPFGENELRFRFETGLGINTTASYDQTTAQTGIDWDRTDLRHVDFQYETARYGTFYIGQGSMATDGLGDIDGSGTGLATSVSIGDIAGSYQLRTTGGALSGITIGDAFNNFDGSRRGRVRYDSPSFSGFTFRAAYGQDVLTAGNTDDFWDIGLAYDTELANGIGIEAGLGYQVRERTGTPDREDTFASIAFDLPSGFNVTLAAGDRNTDGNYYYAKLGYAADLLPIGETAFSVDFYSGSDNVTVGDDAETYGIGIVQDIDNLGVEAYFGYRNYSYNDTTGTTYQDADGYVIGARWRF